MEKETLFAMPELNYKVIMVWLMRLWSTFYPPARDVMMAIAINK